MEEFGYLDQEGALEETDLVTNKPLHCLVLALNFTYSDNT